MKITKLTLSQLAEIDCRVFVTSLIVRATDNGLRFGKSATPFALDIGEGKLFFFDVGVLPVSAEELAEAGVEAIDSYSLQKAGLTEEQIRAVARSAPVDPSKLN